MSRIILATGCDKNYYSRPVFNAYISSLKQVSRADVNAVFSIGFKPQNDLSITYFETDISKVKTPNSNNCLQHGGFLEGSSIDFDDDDVIIFTDADIILQRWFTDIELHEVLSIDSNTVLANYNMSQGNTAAVSIHQLGSNEHQIEQLKSLIDYPLHMIPDYNTGVVVAKLSAWKKILDEYNRFGKKALELIPGYWGQQFILNASIARVCNHKQLSYEIHTHTHHIDETGHGPPIKPVIVNGQAFYGDKLIMFAHKFFDF